MIRCFFRNSYNNTPINKSGEFVKGSVGSYLISMESATTRRDQVLPLIRDVGYPVHYISAVDGRNLTSDEVSEVADLSFYKRCFKMLPEKGTLGCSLSHEKVLRLFLQSDYEFALVFEDDAMFDPNILKSTTDQLIKKCTIWDIASFELSHRGCPIDLATLDNNSKISVYLTEVKHSGCYLINRNAARRLLEKFFPIKMPFDHFFTASWEFGVKFVGVEPRIVTQRPIVSQIKTNNIEKDNSCISLLIKGAYLALRGVLNFIYNFKTFLEVRS